MDALGSDDPLVRGDVNRVQEDVLERSVAVAAQNPDRVIDVAGVNRVAGLEQFVQLAEQLAAQRLLGQAAGDFQRVARDPDPYAQAVLDGPHVSVVLSQQVGKQALIVEMKLQGIFSG